MKGNMVEAKITNLNPVQVTGYRLPKPDLKDYPVYIDWNLAQIEYLESKVIADVENVKYEFTTREENCIVKHTGVNIIIGDYMHILSLNQSCFIELTGEGKCKIVSLRQKAN